MELEPVRRRVISLEKPVDCFAETVKKKFQEAGIIVIDISRNGDNLTIEVNSNTVNKDNRKKIESDIFANYSMNCVRSLLYRNIFYVEHFDT